MQISDRSLEYFSKRGTYAGDSKYLKYDLFRQKVAKLK